MEGAALDDRTLRRIIAMLVALAALAERAGSRSFPVRWLVLSLLRPAEAVARDLVAATARMDWLFLDDEPGTGTCPADATLLGLRLRMLAAVLDALLPAARHCARSIARIHRAPRRLVPGAVRLLAVCGSPARQPHDTS